MSREERKMAQIIASIERMEQRKAPTPSSATSARTDTSAESDGNASSSSGNAASATGDGTRTGTGGVAATSAPSSTVSLERMNSCEIHAQVQKSSARLGAKGRKLKPLALSSGSTKVKAKVKASGGSKRAKASKELVVVDTMAVVECKLTPKKRWIQLWTEQLSSSSDEAMDCTDVDAAPCSASTAAEQRRIDRCNGRRDGNDVVERADSLSKAADETTAREPEQEPTHTADSSDSELPLAVDAPVPVASSLAPTAMVSIAPSSPAMAALTCSPVQPTCVRPTIAVKERVRADGADEREEGEELPRAEHVQPDASLASPSPQTDDQKDTTISPVASVKESLRHAADALTPPSKKKNSDERVVNVVTPTVAAPAAAPAAAPHAEPHAAVARSVRPAAVTATAVTRVDTSGSADAGDAMRTASARQLLGVGPLVRASPSAGSGDHDRSSSRKRSLERKDSEPLTEDEKRRAERRRQRKSNWDVGDPRLGFGARSSDSVGGSGGGPSPFGNDSMLPSTFPVGRPAWRHSSSMDATHSSAKSSFANRPGSLHRPGVGFGGASVGGPPRRAFYASNSMPLDRSRSAGRSATTFHYPTSYR